MLEILSNKKMALRFGGTGTTVLGVAAITSGLAHGFCDAQNRDLGNAADKLFTYGPMALQGIYGAAQGFSTLYKAGNHVQDEDIKAREKTLDLLNKMTTGMTGYKPTPVSLKEQKSTVYSIKAGLTGAAAVGIILGGIGAIETLVGYGVGYGIGALLN